MIPCLSKKRRLMLVGAGLALAACGKPGGGTPARYGLGRTAAAQEVAAVDIDVGPDGAGFRRTQALR